MNVWDGYQPGDIVKLTLEDEEGNATQITRKVLTVTVDGSKATIKGPDGQPTTIRKLQKKGWLVFWDHRPERPIYTQAQYDEIYSRRYQAGKYVTLEQFRKVSRHPVYGRLLSKRKRRLIAQIADKVEKDMLDRTPW